MSIALCLAKIQDNESDLQTEKLITIHIYRYTDSILFHCDLRIIIFIVIR